MDKKTAIDILTNASKQNSIDPKTLKEAFLIGAKLAPSDVLFYAKLLEGKDYKDAVIDMAFHVAAKTKPTAVMHYLTLMKGKEYEEPLLKQAFQNGAKIEAGETLGYLYLIEGKPYYEQVLGTAFPNAAKTMPHMVLRNIEIIQGKPYYEKTLATTFNTAVKTQPMTVITNADLIKGRDYEYTMIKEAFLAAAQKEPKNAWEFRALLEGKKYKSEIYRTITASTEGAQAFGHLLNSLHNEPDAIRFKELKELTASHKFDLITLGRAEVYTSTYNGILNSLIEDIRREGKPLTQILSPEQMKRMDVFLEAATSYKRIDDVLHIIAPSQLPKIIEKMISRIGSAPELEYSGTLTTIMLELRDQPALRHQLESNVKSRYEHAQSQEEKDRFGLIASAYGKSCQTISPDMKPFFVGIANNAIYRMPSMSNLSRTALIDNKGVCNQLMVFANDKDSQYSFDHWKSTYAKKDGWKIEEHESYICIRSTHATGTPVCIYANKPDHHDDGLSAINSAVAESQNREKPSFQVFIGRGHSYNAKHYLHLIGKDTSLVHLGSCGGFQNLGIVMHKAPGAQIISTQETGSMFVNDPLLFSINESIRKTGTVEWPAKQKELEGFASKYKEDYLLPNKNIPAMMHKAYSELAQRRKQSAETGIETAAELSSYIQDRATEKLFHSNGTIDPDELNKILKAAKMLGKKIDVIQTSGENDKIILTDQTYRVTFTVKLDNSIKSQSR